MAYVAGRLLQLGMRMAILLVSGSFIDWKMAEVLCSILIACKECSLFFPFNNCALERLGNILKCSCGQGNSAYCNPN
jgi:hypothetical protein